MKANKKKYVFPVLRSVNKSKRKRKQLEDINYSFKNLLPMNNRKRLARCTNQYQCKEGNTQISCYYVSSDSDDKNESDISVFEEEDILSDHLSDLNLDEKEYDTLYLKEKVKDANIRVFNEYFRSPGSGKSENGEYQVMYTVVFNPSKCFQFKHNTSRVSFFAVSKPFEYAIAVPSPKIPSSDVCSPKSNTEMTSAIASCSVYDNLHVRPHIIMSESSAKKKLASKFPKMKLEILPQGKDYLPLLWNEKLISCPASYLCTPNSNIPEWQKKVKSGLCDLINDDHIQTVMKKNSGSSSTRSKSFFFNNGYEASNCKKYKKDLTTGALEPSIFNTTEMGSHAKAAFCFLQRLTLGGIMPAMGYKDIYHKKHAGKSSHNFIFKHSPRVALY